MKQKQQAVSVNKPPELLVVPIKHSGRGTGSRYVAVVCAHSAAWIPAFVQADYLQCAVPVGFTALHFHHGAVWTACTLLGSLLQAVILVLEARGALLGVVNPFSHLQYPLGHAGQEMAHCLHVPLGQAFTMD